MKELVKEALSAEMQRFQEGMAAAASDLTQIMLKLPEGILYVTQMLQSSRVAGRLSH